MLLSGNYNLVKEYDLLFYFNFLRQDLHYVA
jgi:hypothetical protein